MTTGDIIVSHGTGVISRLIQKFTHSYWSHCRVAISDDSFVEATWPRVRIGRLAEIVKEEHVILTHVVPLNSRENTALLTFLLEQVGKKYDWRGLISFLIGSNVQNKSWFFCSEIAKDACEKARRMLLRRKSFWTTPDDVYSSLMLNISEEGE